MTITEERTIAQERVADGAALLDEKVPGWALLVTGSFLDMSSNEDCVLGRLCTALGIEATQTSPYMTMAHRLFGDPNEWGSDYTTDYGFDGGCPCRCNGVTFGELGTAWRAEIERRQA